MDFGGGLSDNQIEALRQEFAANPKISDAQLMYGDARTIVETTATSTSIFTLADLDSDIIVEYSNQTFSDSQGQIFTSNFYSNEIGLRLREKLITGADPGIYSSNSPYYHGIFISESLAETARVQQGNLLSYLTLSIRKQDPEDLFTSTTISEVTLENITIAGVIASDAGASAGLFTEAILGSTGEIYLPEELFYDQNKTGFLDTLKENEMQYAVLKINEKEFNLEDPQRVNSQINQLINEYEKEHPELIGTNLVESQLLPFQLLSIFIFIFDGILTIPVAILSLYLLSFGIDLSLHERRYQVGILKTQGASPKQIKRRILMETFFLAALGLIIGYIIAIFGAWGIGTATGFMKWDWDYAISQLPDFFYFDQTAFFIVGGLIVIILFLMVNGKSNTFIEMEIVESVRRIEETKKPNFLRRNNLDIIFFAIGVLVLIVVFLSEFGITISFGPVGFLLALLGPPFFWIGGAAVVARLAVWLPPKLDPIIKKIGFLKDVSILIKGNVFRKSGNIPRLSLIIALTVSFSILAAVQGTTGEIHQERLITYDIGADISVTTGQNFSITMIDNIKASSSDIKEVMALSTTSGLLLNDPVEIHSVNSDKYASVGKWQSDSIPRGEPNKDQILTSLANNLNGCLMGKSILREKSLEIGENITLEFLTYYWNGSMVNFGFLPHNVTIHGIFDHAPGSIGSSGIIVDHSLINKISNISALVKSLDLLPPEFLQLVPISLMNQLKGYTNDSKAILASRYLVQVNKGADVKLIKDALMIPENDWIISVKTLKGEIQKSNEIQNMDFGIPGLLTADFVISLLAATLATFIFILTSVIWGLFIGIGLSILFNGFFEFMDVFITPLSAIIAGGPINRVLIFDWVGLLGTISITFFAMLIATFLSVRGTAKAKISEVVREL
jgi:hypothetical protein